MALYLTNNNSSRCEYGGGGTIPDPSASNIPEIAKFSQIIMVKMAWDSVILNQNLNNLLGDRFGTPPLCATAYNSRRKLNNYIRQVVNCE